MKETETSLASLLPLFAEVRRFCMAIRLSSSVCCSKCMRGKKRGEDGERQIEVEEERGELKEKHTCMTMRMSVEMTQDLSHEVHVTQHQRV